MRYNPQVHRRRSIRLKGYDYSWSGAYFVTICTHEREMALENPVVMQVIHDAWFGIPTRFPFGRAG